jgi:A/G-specific adenine glycosylase
MSRPVRIPKKKVPQYIHAAGVIMKGRRALLIQRPSGGLLGGMWEFPNGRVDGNPAGGLTKALRSAYKLKVRRRETLGEIKHAYTHYKVTVHVFRCDPLSISGVSSSKWVLVKDLGEYPMGKVDRRIAQRVLEFLESN